MPYNEIKAGKYSDNRNLYDENGNPLPTDSERYNERLYKTQGTNNFYFGMYMSVNFSQPEDGMAEHNGKTSPMIYEFNGDDDLWIYIDDVLVLDIGGIHDAHSGYIDFTTGKVHVDGTGNGQGEYPDTTIKKMYWKAQKFPDGSNWNNYDDPKVENYFTGDTFRDYTTHTLKMFYMERGAGASNLHMRFNLQTVPEGTVEVTKDLTNTDKENYANVEFAFQLLVQEIISTDAQGNENYGNEYITLSDAVDKDTKEAITFHDDVEIKGTKYNDVFYLKPGETAQFSGLQNNRKYYVREIGVNTSEYYAVIINGTVIFQKNEDGTISSIENAECGEDEVGNRSSVTFQNSCSLLNRRELRITKAMAEGQTTTDTFTFRVQLESTDGELENYTGDYYLTDAQGNYWYYQNEKLVSNGKESIKCGAAQNGLITGVPVGYTIAITDILSGTSFKVEEVNLDEIYMNPEKELKEGTYTTEGCLEGADGEILLGRDAQVTVTNSKNVKSLYVEKTWETSDGENVGKDTVTFGLFKQNANGTLELMQVADITAQNQWKHTFTNLPVKENNSDITYTVREIEEATQTEGKTYTLNGKQYRILNESDYINEYYHASDEVDGLGTSSDPVKIENGLKTFGINVVKKDSDGNWLEGVEFELCLDKEGTQKVHFTETDGKYVYSSDDGVGSTTTLVTDSTTGQTNEKDNPNLVITGLPADTYYLIETKTKNGFSLLANPVEIVLPCESNERSDKQEPYYEESNGSTTTYFYDSNTVDITNNKLFTMPEAGGRNIFMLTLAGTAMIALAAGSTICYRRRHGAHNKVGR